jgi:hypothetical protein
MTQRMCPRLTKDILRFYVEHPGVAETPEGLARWRLLEQYVEDTCSCRKVDVEIKGAGLETSQPA